MTETDTAAQQLAVAASRLIDQAETLNHAWFVRAALETPFVADFQRTRRQFVALFVRVERDLVGLVDPRGFREAGCCDVSACGALRRLADSLAESLECGDLEKPTGIRVDWSALRLAVECELAVLRRQAPPASKGLTPKQLRLLEAIRKLDADKRGEQWRPQEIAKLARVELNNDTFQQLDQLTNYRAHDGLQVEKLGGRGACYYRLAYPEP